MKRVVFVCIVVFSVLFVFAPCRVRACAETDGDVDEIAAEQIGELDLTELERYAESIGLTGESIAERLVSYVKGGGVDYGSFTEGVISIVFGRVKELLPAFCSIAAISLLSGVLETMKSGFIGETTSEVVSLVSFVAALAPLLSVLVECFSVSRACISSIKEQTEIVFPLLITLTAASGGSVSAAIFQPVVAFFSTTIVGIANGVVLPLAMTATAFSIAGRLSPSIKLKRFSDFFKSANKWIVGICVSVFGAFFTVRGLTSAVYDGAARRAAKYAIGTGVPVLGGFLAGGFDLAVAGSVLVKNAIGSLGLAMTVTVLIEPIALLIAVNMLLKLTAAICEPFGDKRTGELLEETAGNLNYCTAGVLLVGFLYFVVIVLLVCASEVIL